VSPEPDGGLTVPAPPEDEADEPLTMGLPAELLVLELFPGLAPVVKVMPLGVPKSGAEEAPVAPSMVDEGSAPPCPELGNDLLGLTGLYSPALWASLLIPLTAPAANAPNITTALIAPVTASDLLRGIKAG